MPKLVFIVFIICLSAFAEEKCGYNLEWKVEKSGFVNGKNILGTTDFGFIGSNEILVLNFPPEGKEQAPLQLYKFQNGKWNFNEKNSSKLPLTFHPRHINVEDLENDGIKEIMIADHGPDKAPFVGAKPVVLRKAGKEWTVDTSTKDISPAFTFNTSVLPFADQSTGIYTANVGTHKPVLYKKNKANIWEDASKLVPSELVRELCLMTAVKDDFDGNGTPDLYLGGCDRPYENKIQNHDRILVRDGESWKLLPPATLPPRRKNSKWGTVFAKSVDFNGDGKNDIMVALHDYGFHNWELWGYENQSTPGKFKFREVQIPVKQELETEGFAYSIEDFEVGGIGKMYIAQVRPAVRDPKKKKSVLWHRLFIYENKKFKDISSCLPEVISRDFMNIKKYPDVKGKLLVVPFKGNFLSVTVSKKP